MFVQVLFEGLVMGAIYALIAMGIALVWGVMNILSFSQGEFMMISMYLAFYLNQSLKLDPLLSIPIVAVVMFFFGVMIYLLLIKKALKGPLLSQRLVTFSLGLVLTNGMLMLAGGQYKNIPNLLVQGSIDLGVLTISKQKLVPLVICIVVTTLLFWFMKKTTLGNAISATAQDKMAAELIGINTNRAYMIAFGLSASIAGIAGCALTYFYYINPTVGAPFLIFGFIAVCIGGFGSIIGAFLGGLLMGFIDLFTGTYLSVSYKYLAICMLFIIIVSWKPKGLFGR
ncbi:branched-chain amino acid transport system permease [Enterococcus sp. DIV2402]|uniref:Branched-chain amino acid transport system permease n=1 Tax=Candidatus Enterococcus lowellii TaxID=2230877 RepID=A0ABZ2SU07_9ENTE|nr:branched-chain amino acid ABC transporter permease [Enterococcus sp. DIV2402]MBO0463312.1 branched-chain amino acid ABC transporter permease [Enterococcus sp. DIV2402]